VIGGLGGCDLVSIAVFWSGRPPHMLSPRWVVHLTLVRLGWAGPSLGFTFMVLEMYTTLVFWRVPRGYRCWCGAIMTVETFHLVSFLPIRSLFDSVLRIPHVQKTTRPSVLPTGRGESLRTGTLVNRVSQRRTPNYGRGPDSFLFCPGNRCQTSP